MCVGIGAAEKTIITALHLTGRALTIGEVVAAFPKSHARAIRNAAFSLEAKGVVRLSDGRPMPIYSASQPDGVAPSASQPSCVPRPAPLTPQQPRPTPLAPQQPRPTPQAPEQPRPAPLAPQQPRPTPLSPQQPCPTPLPPQQPRPTPLPPQQPRPAPLASQQPRQPARHGADLSPADALAAKIARDVEKQKLAAALLRQTTV
jgi:hypothetical protein